MFNRKVEGLLDRYVAGKANREEIAWIEENFNSDNLAKLVKKKLEKDWNNFKEDDNSNIGYLLDRIHHSIHLKEGKTVKSFVHNFYIIYTKVAAILLIPLIFTFIFFLFNRNNTEHSFVQEESSAFTINAPMGSRLKFDLPDGSSGYLNSGSSLSYCIPFSTNRNVDLQGEAWFDVTKDAEHPFNIRVGSSVVKVLGTSFNLFGYDENHIELVLEEGAVEFKNNITDKTFQVKPNELLVMNEKSVTIDKTDPEKYHGWTEGKLILRGDKMEEVARRLERWYNVNIEIGDKELEGYVLHGTFQDDSLNEVLDLLSMISPISCKIIPRKKLPDGTWEKQTVILTKMIN